MKKMNYINQIIEPSQDMKVKTYHQDKYKIYLELYQDQMKYKNIMKKWEEIHFI
jgi:hypothetical protein